MEKIKFFFDNWFFEVTHTEFEFVLLEPSNFVRKNSLNEFVSICSSSQLIRFNKTD